MGGAPFLLSAARRRRPLPAQRRDTWAPLGVSPMARAADPLARMYAERRYAAAAEGYAARCRARPNDADAWLGHGQTLLALGRWAEARRSLDAARRLADGALAYAVIDARRAEAAAGQGDIAAAEALFRASLAVRPDAATEARLGTMLLNVGRLEDAEVALAGAVARGGGALTEVVASLATVRSQRGRAQEALDGLRGAPADDPATALARARACLQLRRAEEALPGLDAALRRAAPAQAWLLHHARAELLDQLDDVVGAAGAYAAMHAVRGDHADPQGILDHADRIVGTWTTTIHGRLAGGGAPPVPPPPAPDGAPRPVFIVGLPRTGTSLCEQALAAHPGVYAAGEREELRRIAALLGPALGAPWPECTPSVPRAAASAARSWRDAVGGDRPVVTDKMPDNLLRLGLASQLFPDARAIWMRRGLLDTLLSCWQQAFGPAYAWAGDWDGLAAQALAHERVGRRWLATVPMPICVVAYEDLVRTPARELSEILAFLDLPWDDGVTAPEAVARTVATASILQVRAAIHTGSIGRWRRYAAVLEPLRARLEAYGLDAE